MTIKELQKEVHKVAVSKGWWDNPPEFGTLIALCHSELSEALEEARKGLPYLNCSGKTHSDCECDCEACDLEIKKPEGIAIELADVVIRIMDMCGRYNIDLEAAIQLKHEYNKTRPYKHGGKEF